jgi:hypothetical protein
LALKGSLQPLTLLSQRIVTIGLEDDGDLMIQELEELTNESVLPENLSPTTLSQAHIDIISSSNGIPLLTGDEQASLLKLAKALLQVCGSRRLLFIEMSFVYQPDLLARCKQPGVMGSMRTGVNTYFLWSTTSRTTRSPLDLVQIWGLGPGRIVAS